MRPLAILPRGVLRLARRYAAVDATILITGETGVGKDALARYIHSASSRRREPFVIVDCPALPTTLVESELFGHERGAFTDARAARAGRFEQAGHGTIYLDAVAGLSAQSQGALLRILEEHCVTRLGAATAISLHARVIASLNGRAEELVAAHQLRPDLYHRLAVLPIAIPPLRDRRHELIPLVRRFIDEVAERIGRPIPALSGPAEEALRRYEWPGNLRELHHVVERVLLTTPGNCIDAGCLPPDVLHGGDLYQSRIDGQRPTLAEVERRYIELTLQSTGGNQTRAAEILGISRKGLWEKRKRLASA
jgi:transcriptional regulator with PAS, ATPase and Fis domain